MVDHVWGNGSECDGVTRSIERDLQCLRIATPDARGLVFVQGAHVAAWQPAHGDPVLWMSARAVYAPGKALRGGVPICFPWFGAHSSRADLPAHGFARTSDWEYAGSEALDDAVRLSFALGADERTRAMFDHEFTATFRATFGTELLLELAVENAGDTPMKFEAALHTYLSVSDVRRVTLEGLAGARYEDKVLDYAASTQGEAPLAFAGETDRVYASSGACTLIDPVLRRSIVVDKTGSSSTVVWNPWIEKARAMEDFGDDEWPGMLCIETANARSGAVELGSGETHRMSARIGVARREG